MLEAKCQLQEQGPLATVHQAASGWRGADDSLSLTAMTDISAALVTLRRRAGESLAVELAELLGTSLPAEFRAACSTHLTIVSVGRDRYLVVKRGDRSSALASMLRRDLEGRAAIVDHSDELTFLALDGAAAPRVLSALCSIDFGPRAFTPGSAAVTRLHGARAHIWLEVEPHSYTICVPRSLAVYAWHSLVEACSGQTVLPMC